MAAQSNANATESGMQQQSKSNQRQECGSSMQQQFAGNKHIQMNVPVNFILEDKVHYQQSNTETDEYPGNEGGLGSSMSQ